METTKLCLLFIFLLTFSCKSRDKAELLNEQNKNFDLIFRKVERSIMYHDIDQAVRISDSLLQNAKGDYQKMRSHLLAAEVFQRKGSFSEAIAHAHQADELAKENHHIDYRIKTLSFLSTVYRWVNLTHESKHTLDRAESIILHPRHRDKYPSAQVTFYQEKALFIMEERDDYEAAARELYIAEELLEKIEKDHPLRNYQDALNHYLFGICFLHLDEWGISQNHFLATLEIIDDTSSSLWAYTRFRMGDLEMRKQNFEEAYQYYREAEKFVERTGNTPFSLQLEKSLTLYYKSMNDDTNQLIHQEKYIHLLQQRNERAKRVSNEVINILVNKKNISIKLNMYLFSLVVALVTTTFGVVFYNSRRTGIKNLKNGQKRSRRKDFLYRWNLSPELTEKATEDKSAYISDETEARIILNLEKLEASEYYLKPDISLATLASRLNSNTKYVAYVIGKYRNNDFTSYVHRLRIGKVIRDLLEDENLLNFKISYLAKKYGFTSHSSFTVAFKNETGMTPSQFIADIKKEDPKETEEKDGKKV